jgi:hypothetical protein
MVTLAVAIESAQLRITLENPGPYRPAGNGRGLRMLRRQLQAAYGARARLELVAAGVRTRATLTLPQSGPR